MTSPRSPKDPLAPLIARAAGFGIPESLFRWRYSKGLTGRQLYMRPKLLIEIGGETFSPRMAAERFGVSEHTIKTRFKRGVRGFAIVDRVEAHSGGLQTVCSAEDRQRRDCARHLETLARVHKGRALRVLADKKAADRQGVTLSDYYAMSLPERVGGAGVTNAARLTYAARTSHALRSGGVW